LSSRLLILFTLLFLFSAASSLRAEDKPPSGEAVYRAHCVQCHGMQATGTDKGPPLVHRFYHPNHHADITFRWAVQRGVRAHHWRFGDMPKIQGIGPEETEAVIAYIRGLQKKAGIY